MKRTFVCSLERSLSSVVPTVQGSSTCDIVVFYQLGQGMNSDQQQSPLQACENEKDFCVFLGKVT